MRLPKGLFDCLLSLSCIVLHGSEGSAWARNLGVPLVLTALSTLRGAELSLSLSSGSRVREVCDKKGEPDS